MRLTFAGTPAFALPALKALQANGHEIAAVYTQPDRRAGRGRRFTAGPVKQYAVSQRLSVHQPATLRDEAPHLSALAPDAFVVVAYGLLLPAAILEIPRYGCINVHASLLPRWRGAAPIARAIEAGDRETGVTIMRMDAGLDTGPILLQQRTPISDLDTTALLEERLARLGADALVVAIERMARNALPPEAQDDALASHAPKLQKHEAPIDWSQPALVLHRKIRAFNPRPVATTTWRGQTLRLWEVGPLASDTGPPTLPAGTVAGIEPESVLVQTGQGALNITRLQTAGGRVLSAREFLNGTPLKPGDRLGN